MTIQLTSEQFSAVFNKFEMVNLLKGTLSTLSGVNNAVSIADGDRLIPLYLNSQVLSQPIVDEAKTRVQIRINEFKAELLGYGIELV